MWLLDVKRGMGFALIAVLMIGQSYAAGVKLRWQPNNEPDLAGYRVCYGLESGKYENKIDVGNVTEYQLSGLLQATTYYFALTAYDKTGNESPFSDEISFVLGDTQPPEIASVTPLSLTQIQVRFTELVKTSSATNTANYTVVDGPAVLEAVLQNDQQTVHLRTESHESGKNYTLLVQNVQDRAVRPNTIAAGSSVDYSFDPNIHDTTPPTILLASLVNASELRIYFSEPISEISAINKAHYSIQPDVQAAQDDE